jgi:serine/threonine protein kinase
MAVQRSTHPSADVLKAFALGKLNDGSSEVVLSHLDQCQACRQEVASQSGDDFLNRLRRAHGSSSTPAPAKALGDVSRAPQPPASHAPVPNLPPELANNPQYEILRELGRGGMGVVYLAKNKLMDRFEVLKVVNKALLDHPAAVERFLREIRAAAKLSHPNVVAAYSAVQIGELLAFAMEYVEGQDLAGLVKSQGPLPVPHACFYVQQAASGLQHAYEKGMVHRDIKPQNLILAREDKKHIVKVLDFGLAKATREKKDDTGLTGEGKMLGTPDYIAPEQTLDAAKADIRADIYSLGCTLYYLLSGHPPFSANSLGAILLAHQMNEAKTLNLERPEVPEELAAVVRKMMAKSPAKRYQTPLEVVQALSPFVKQGATPKASSELSSSAAAPKPVVQLATPLAPPPAPPVAVPKPQPQPADVWGSLTDDRAASVVPKKSGTRSLRAATVRERSSQMKWLIGGGIAAAVLLLGMWAGGVFEVKTKYGTLVVEVNEPNPHVYVDDEKVTVRWHNGGKKGEIHIEAGPHKVQVKKDGFSVDAKELTFKDGDRVIFTARLLPKKPQEDQAKAGAPPSGKSDLPPDTKTLGVDAKAKQLEDLLVAGSTWQGPGSFREGNLVLYVQQPTGSTFRAVHAYHWVEDGVLRNFVRHVQGEVKGNTLNYHSTGSDGFRVTGTWNTDCLDITHQSFDGNVATAKLKPDEAKSTSANCVVSVFRRNDPEGWYTLNHDGTEGATRAIGVDSSKNHGFEHDDFYWLLANPIHNGKEFGWHAPEKFHGDHSGKFGRCLIYEIFCAETGQPPPTDWYVVLRGAGMTLFVDGTTLEPPASKTWKVYRIRLDTSAGWKFPGSEPASNDDIKAVLADVTDLRIKGEYGRKTVGCLKTVEFGVEDPFEKR